MSSYESCSFLIYTFHVHPIQQTYSLVNIMILYIFACTSVTSSDTDSSSHEDSAHEGINSGWYSELYPETWKPTDTSSEGRFIHDFSYAGYHNGEEEPSILSSMNTFSVLDYGADSEGEEDATQAFQDAIHAAQDGGVVWIPEGLYRIDQLLKIENSNIILAGESPEKSRLWFTKSTSMTDQSSILFRGTIQQGAEALLSQDAPSRSNHIYVDHTDDIEIGQDVSIGWVITDEFVADHNMSNYWMTFRGQWVSFFRRSVVGIEENRVILDVPIRYPIYQRDQASIRVEEGYLSECGVQNISISNAIEKTNALLFDRAHAIQLEATKDCWVDHVASFAAPDQEEHLQSGGIKVLSSKRATISNSSMEQSQHLGDGGNGYLFEISQSSEILIRDSVARAGRHNFIQNWGFGTSGCVFLRTESRDGEVHFDDSGSITGTGFSEFHHSLAMANLIDNSLADDGWKAVNRLFYSSGAGHSATENVFWNIKGDGSLYSYQYGHGYVIGSTNIDVYTEVSDVYDSNGTAPEDYSEGIGEGETLIPQSLYEDQLQKRLAQ